MEALGPRSIVNFERLYLLTLVIGAVHAALQWPTLTAMSSPGLVLSVQLITFCITLLLVLLVSRRRSKIARIVLVAAFLIGLPTVADFFRSGIFGAGIWVLVAQLALQVVALALLFAPDSRRWFDHGTDSEGLSPSATD